MLMQINNQETREIKQSDQGHTVISWPILKQNLDFPDVRKHPFPYPILLLLVSDSLLA